MEFGGDLDMVAPANYSGLMPTPDALTRVLEPASVMLLGKVVAALGLGYRSRLARCP